MSHPVVQTDPAPAQRTLDLWLEERPRAAVPQSPIDCGQCFSSDCMPSCYDCFSQGPEEASPTGGDR